MGLNSFLSSVLAASPECRAVACFDVMADSAEFLQTKSAVWRVPAEHYRARVATLWRTGEALDRLADELLGDGVGGVGQPVRQVVFSIGDVSVVAGQRDGLGVLAIVSPGFGLRSVGEAIEGLLRDGTEPALREPVACER